MGRVWGFGGFGVLGVLGVWGFGVWGFGVWCSRRAPMKDPLRTHAPKVLGGSWHLCTSRVLITELGHLRDLYMGYKYSYTWLIRTYTYHEPPTNP